MLSIMCFIFTADQQSAFRSQLGQCSIVCSCSTEGIEEYPSRHIEKSLLLKRIGFPEGMGMSFLVEYYLNHYCVYRRKSVS